MHSFCCNFATQSAGTKLQDFSYSHISMQFLQSCTDKLTAQRPRQTPVLKLSCMQPHVVNLLFKLPQLLVAVKTAANQTIRHYVHPTLFTFPTISRWKQLMLSIKIAPQYLINKYAPVQIPLHMFACCSAEQN